MRATLAVFVLLASPFIVNAFPPLWTGEVLPNEVLNGAELTPTNCIRHPTTKQAGHGAPVVDRAITIEAVAGGRPVTELCPGVETTVTVNYPERRRTLLTSTEGSWDKGDRLCPGRTLTTRTQASFDTYSSKLTIPCNSTADSTTLQVTSATGSSAAYRTASMTMPIAALASCPASRCPPRANRTIANETVLEEDMLAANETMDGNMTLSANETMDGNMTLSGNETMVEEEDVMLNGTAAGNATRRNVTRGAVADKAAEAVNATATKDAVAAAAKPKSAAASSSPAGVLAAAAALLAAAAIVL